MSNWIDEAKRQVVLNKEKEEQEKLTSQEVQKKIKSEEEERIHQILISFIQDAGITFMEIEKIFESARNQVLVVNGPELCCQMKDYYYSDERIGNYASFWRDYTQGLEEGRDYYSYYVSWRIELPNTTNSLRIKLGLKNKGGIYTPTNTPQGIEIEIKKWLVQIFSEQK